MASKVIRNITKVFRATSGRLFGRVSASTGRGEELTPTQVRTLLSVPTSAEVAAAYQPIGSYAAASHVHGNITNAGAIGTTAALPIITGTSGVLQAGSFGTTVGTFCQGNDSRLSDARTPTAHTHTTADITGFNEAVDDEVASLLIAGTNISITYNDAANTLTITNTAAGLSGTGSVDNAVLRADGTGGATLQSSAIVIDDLFTASPNNTVNYVCMKPTGGTTNVGVAIVPKGTGAFSLAVPDGTPAGGNARGANAIDLSTARSAATDVASGSSAVLIGVNCASTAVNTIAIGRVALALSNNSIAIGANSTTVATGSGTSSIAIGDTVTAGGTNSLAIGNGVSSSNYLVFGFGRSYSLSRPCSFGWSAGNISQTTEYLLGQVTSGTTPGILYLRSVFSTTDILSVTSGKILHGTLWITGSKSDGSVTARYVRNICIKNVGGTVSLDGTVDTVGTDQASGTSISIAANNTNKTLEVTCTGITGETWRWSGLFKALDQTYGT